MHPKAMDNPPATAAPTAQDGIIRRGSEAANEMAPSVINYSPIIKFTIPD